MTELWYNNIHVLFQNTNQFFPSNNLTNNEKVNAMARMAIYYSIIIIITGSNQSYITLSIVLLILSILLGISENFSTEINKKNSKCIRPTVNNPFMNFTTADYYNNPDRPKNCPIDEVRDEMITTFQKRIVPDPNDLWGQNIGDRNFYTMPSTTIINDQTGFANWLYGSIGQCKANGKNCIKRALSKTSTGMFGSPI